MIGIASVYKAAAMAQHTYSLFVFLSSLTVAMCTISNTHAYLFSQCTLGLSSSAAAGISVAIAVPITAIITAIISVAITYLCTAIKETQ